MSPGWPGHSPRVKSTRLGWQSRSFRLLVRLVQVGDLGLLGCSKSIFPLSEQLCSEDWLQKSGFLIKKKTFQKTPTSMYSAGSPRRGQGTLSTPVGSVALVINKLLNPTFP